MPDSITFIIASFNDAAVIEQTIASIEANLRTDDKIIVVDGNSGDETSSILAKISTEIPQLEYISEPDSGIYDAWNKGLNKSSSKWVCFVGCGDHLRPYYRHSVQAAIHAHPESKFIHGVAQMYLWDNEKNKALKLGTLGKRIEPQEFKRRMRVCHVGALHHHSLFDESLFSTRYKCVSDYLFLLQRLPVLEPTFIEQVLVDMEASGISRNSLFPIKEEYEMKKTLGGYGRAILIVRMLWTSTKHYLFKIYNFRYRLKWLLGNS